MPVLVVLLLAVFFGVMIWFTVSSVRDVAKLAEERRTRSIDQDLVEGRLVRIEEAIDAMAVQIERLTEHQRSLLGGSEPSLPQEDPHRTERPR